MEVSRRYAWNAWAKGQSALEFLITYSWAFLIISIMIVVALILPSVVNSSSYIPSTCYIQPLFPCMETLLTSYTSTQPIHYYIALQNKLQSTVYFPGNSFNVSMYGIGVSGAGNFIGNCTPQLAQPGVQVTCSESISGSVEPSTGSQVNTLFTIGYEICSGTTQGTCGSSVYKTTGYAIQTIGSPGGYYLLTVNTILYQTSSTKINSNGFMLLNGAPYDNDTVLLLPQGSYTLAPQQSANWSFASYSVLSGSSTVSPTQPANGVALLTLNSNTTVQIRFTEALCNLCNWSSQDASLLCPASCTTSSTCTPTTASFTTSTTSASTTSTSVTTTIGQYQCRTCSTPQVGYACPSTCPNPSTCGQNNGGIECVPSSGFGASQSNYSVVQNPVMSQTQKTYSCNTCQAVRPGYTCPTNCGTAYWCISGQSIACLGSAPTTTYEC